MLNNNVPASSFACFGLSGNCFRKWWYHLLGRLEGGSWQVEVVL